MNYRSLRTNRIARPALVDRNELEHAENLKDHLKFCRENERLSYQDLDKFKMSLPALLLAVTTYLNTSRVVSGLSFYVAISCTLLCLGVTAFSMYSAAFANRQSVLSAQTELGINGKDLRPWEVQVGKLVEATNLFSMILAAVSICAVAWMFFDLPPKKESVQKVDLGQNTIDILRDMKYYDKMNNGSQPDKIGIRPPASPALKDPAKSGIQPIPVVPLKKDFLTLDNAIKAQKPNPSTPPTPKTSTPNPGRKGIVPPVPPQPKKGDSGKKK